MQKFHFHRLIRFFLQFTLVLVVTFLLLELTTRLVWWNKTTIFLFNKDIALLPTSLITAQQKIILKEWYAEAGSYVQFDPLLGWSIRPSVSRELNGITYTSNSIGVRSLHEYNLNKPDGITRVAAFGPSFTFGQDVQDSATWPALIEQTRPDLEVMNWGVGAYGTDQAFLRYKNQGVLYHPDIVLIGYEEDNMWRNVNRYRPYYIRDTGAPLTKPVYIFEQNKLTLLKNPFDSFDNFYHTLINEPGRFIDLTCPQDYFCNETRYQPNSLDLFKGIRFLRTLAFEMQVSNQLPKPDRQNPQELSIHIIRQFIAEVSSQHSTPVVILFPQQSRTLLNYENGLNPDYQKAASIIRDVMGVQVVDLADAFVSARQKQNLSYQDFFVGPENQKHYSELGNQIVAQTVLQALCSSSLINC